MLKEFGQKIKQPLLSIANSGGDSCEAADTLVRVLGYYTDRGGKWFPKGKFLDEFSDMTVHEDARQEMRERFNFAVQSVYVASQFTEEDFNRFSLPDSFFVDSKMKCLFVYVKLSALQYQRRDYEEMTGLLNRHLTSSFFVIYYCNKKLNVAFAPRRVRRNLGNAMTRRDDMLEDTLGDVRLVSNIDCENPHQIHLEILSDLSASAIAPKLLAGKGNLFENLYTQWEYAMRSDRQYVVRAEELESALRNIFQYAYQHGYVLNTVILDHLSDIVHHQDFDGAMEFLTFMLGDYKIKIYDEAPIADKRELRDNLRDLINDRDYVNDQIELATSFFANGRLRDISTIYRNEIKKYPLLSSQEEQYLTRMLLGTSQAEEEETSHAEEKELCFSGPDDFAIYDNDALEFSKQKLRSCKNVSQASNANTGNRYLYNTDPNDARNIMINSNYRLVWNIALAYAHNNMAWLDLIQAGNRGLMTAVKKFDPRLRNKFSTYATLWIRQAISREIADRGRIIRVPVHLIEKINKINRVIRELGMRGAIEPTLERLIQETGISESKIHKLLNLREDQTILATCRSKEVEIELGAMIDSSVVDLWDTVIDRARRTFIQRLFMDASLEPRQIEILKKRFGIDYEREYTLEEIGRELGVTRERIRQIEAKAIKKIRRYCTRFSIHTL